MNSSMFGIFRIRKEERWQSLVALAVIILLNALFIHRLSPFFMQEGFGPYWKDFMREFHLSGYDPLTYLGVTGWGMVYNVFRHPLLGSFIFPFYLINSGLSTLLGVNCVQYVVAVPVIFCSYYSYIFTYRIHREIIQLERWDATLMTAFYFSMAYILLSVIVPDHFTISMFLILLTFYVSGKRYIRGRELQWWQSALMFLFTAGVTLSNGVKIFLAGLLMNGKHFFRWRFLLLGVIIPAALLWGFCQWEYRYYVWPREQARAVAKQQKEAEHEREISMMSEEQQKVERERQAKRKKILDRQAAKSGTPMKKVGFLSWTDTSTSRWESCYENLFGETIQFHQQHFLGDTLVFRPVFVPYDWVLNYVVEAIIVLLFLVGIWVGRRSRFLWLTLACFGFDMVIHLGLGFGLNEIFIMAPHWLYVIPFAISYLLKSFHIPHFTFHISMRLLVALITLFLFLYNGIQLVDFLLSPIKATL